MTARAGLLDGRAVIVTGVGPGLGRAIAVAAAEHGARVALAARTKERLDEIAHEITSAGSTAIAVATDVTDPDQCERLVARTVEEFGGVDGLVNSAFSQPPLKTIEDTSMNSWRKAFDFNCHAAIQMTKAAVPALRAAPHASVVMVTTMSIRTHEAKFGAYAAAKSALANAARTLATELGPDGIRVNSIAPGYIWGDPVRLYLQWQAEERGVTEDEVHNDLRVQIPIGHIPTPEEIAGAAVFYLSELSAAVTGTLLDVNGGQFMPSP